MEKRKKAKLLSFKYWCVDLVRINGLPLLLWFRPKHIYENKRAKKKIRGGALLISNHFGFKDPMYVMVSVWYRRMRFICNKVFFRTKALSFMFTSFRCIPVDPRNVGLSFMHDILAPLNDGEIVALFPEGHINTSDQSIDGFKSGMVLMALRARVPIIPMYIKPQAHFYNRLVTVIGEPIDVVARCGERPTLSRIEEVAREIFNKEKELEALAFADRKNPPSSAR